MARICRQCSRVNPDAAAYCHFDGFALAGGRGGAGPIDVGKQPFLAPFVFPSGVVCGNFDQLALSCSAHWAEAVDLLKQGVLVGFLGALGRADLSRLAREAAAAADPDQALDAFLGVLPSGELAPAALRVETAEINLGQLQVGQDSRAVLRLANDGKRLLKGSVTVEGGDWLLLGVPGVRSRAFQCTDSLTLPVQVRGKLLRAGVRPLEGRLVVASNGGQATVRVQGRVPVKPFPEGVLAGATTPREAAHKAKAALQEAARLFENGAAARWYESNGWIYPVRGPAASGAGAIQQYFEALGLVRAPRVEISATSLALAGDPGKPVRRLLIATTVEKRPVYAHAVSNQPWLRVDTVLLEGRQAVIPLIVTATPEQAGQTLTANVTVTANGKQRFVVAVSFAVAAAPPPPRRSAAAPAPLRRPPDSTAPNLPPLPSAAPPPPPREGGEAVPALPFFRGIDPGRWPFVVHLLPLLVVSLALLVVVGRDFFARAEPPPPEPRIAEEPPDLYPRIGVLFHDRGDKLIEQPSRRFGLVMLREKDPANPLKLKRLTYDELGRSNNTCLLIDGVERLFGHPPGRWRIEGAPPSGPGDASSQGERSVWTLDDSKVSVAQEVEVIASEQSRLLDTCLVRYVLHNTDDRPHTVGIRFLLDTYIGANDGVPFTIPGQRDLCDTQLQFDGAANIPDFLQALERQDLENPGTVAHLQLKLGSRLEPPGRLTLGAWPDGGLAKKGAAGARGHLTGWNVPVLPIHTLSPGDSAVTIYWQPQPLAAGATRAVGFAYGLGRVSSQEGKGQLAVTVGGSFRPGGAFTVTTYVGKPVPGQKVKLTAPAGFELLDDVEQAVPPLPAGAGPRIRPITWRVRAPGRGGAYTLEVTSSTGVSQTQRVTIQRNRLFD